MSTTTGPLVWLVSSLAALLWLLLGVAGLIWMTLIGGLFVDAACLVASDGRSKPLTSVEARPPSQQSGG